MRLNEYQQLCLRTWAKREKVHALLNAALGIGGECGEVLDLIKKYKYHDLTEETYREKLQKELGDLLFYVAMYAHERDWTLASAAQRVDSRFSSMVLLDDDGVTFADMSHLVGLAEFDADWRSGKWGMEIPIAFRINRASRLLLDAAHAHLSRPADSAWAAMAELSMLAQLSDLLVGMTALANAARLPLAEIAAANIAKLQARHPSGWNTGYCETTLSPLGNAPQVVPVFTATASESAQLPADAIRPPEHKATIL